ncbi:MAG TPA: hypothetical protein VJ767_11245 [Nitrososphaeraceae archaeon]|nr:hypothetical protein [Nitrososphaeraceae archaeon]
MKKIFISSANILVILAGIAIISASSFSLNEALAKPHASLTLDSDEPNVNPISVVLGHTNEPSFGKLPGLHDGKHFLEVEISDSATTLPIRTATLFADKYYFKDIKSFENAQSLQDADDIELNVPISSVFGSPGLFYNRQVQDPGIYGYTLRGSIDYYGVGIVNIPNDPEPTIFCTIEGKDTSKFNKGAWSGSYGCTQNLKSIFFPESAKYPDKYPPKYPKSNYPEPENPNPGEYSDYTGGYNYGSGYGNENEYQTYNSGYRTE